jgi:hypothetical protein
MVIYRLFLWRWEPRLITNIDMAKEFKKRIDSWIKNHEIRNLPMAILMNDFDQEKLQPPLNDISGLKEGIDFVRD